VTQSFTFILVFWQTPCSDIYHEWGMLGLNSCGYEVANMKVSIKGY
jgi:hypothetical protein